MRNKKINSILNAIFRLISYTIVVINLFTGGIFLYLIAPYTSYFFFNDLRFWKYLKYYHKYFFYSASYIWALLNRERGLIKSVLTLTSDPMDRPDPALFCIAKHWNLPADSCGECYRCCIFVIECCFLDKSKNRCMTYGSLYWKYFNCGRFPSSQAMLDYVKCPKYEIQN